MDDHDDDRQPSGEPEIFRIEESPASRRTGCGTKGCLAVLVTAGVAGALLAMVFRSVPPSPSDRLAAQAYDYSQRAEYALTVATSPYAEGTARKE